MASPLTYNPSIDSIVLARPIGSLYWSTDGRSTYPDTDRFVRRQFQSLEFVKSYFNNQEFRRGFFSIYVNETGVLNESTGFIDGGVTKEYWWKEEDLSDDGLIEKSPDLADYATTDYVDAQTSDLAVDINANSSAIQAETSRALAAEALKANAADVISPVIITDDDLTGGIYTNALFANQRASLSGEGINGPYVRFIQFDSNGAVTIPSDLLEGNFEAEIGGVTGALGNFNERLEYVENITNGERISYNAPDALNTYTTALNPAAVAATRWNIQRLTKTILADTISFYCARAGAIDIYIIKDNFDGTMEADKVIPFTATLGLNTFTSENGDFEAFNTPENGFVGSYFGTTAIGTIGTKIKANTSYSIAGELPDDPTSIAAPSSSVEIGLSISGRGIPINEEIDIINEDLTEVQETLTEMEGEVEQISLIALGGQDYTFGAVTPDLSGHVSALGNGTTRGIYGDSGFPSDGVLGSIVVSVARAGVVTIRIEKKTQTTNEFMCTNVIAVTLTTGIHTLVAGVDFPNGILIYKGGFWTTYNTSATGCVGFKNVAPTTKVKFVTGNVTVEVGDKAVFGAADSTPEYGVRFNISAVSSFDSIDKNLNTLDKAAYGTVSLAQDALVQVTKSGTTRNDNAGAIRLTDGGLMCGFGTFVAGTGDADQAYLKFNKSLDNGISWQSYSTIQPNTGTGNYIPSFYRKANGNILMVYLVKLPRISGVPVSYVAYKISTDEGLTWGSEVPITSTSDGKYIVISANRMYKSGSFLYMPYALLISGSGSSGDSVYAGKLLRSGDDGVTWADTGITINEPTQNLVVEPGVFKNSLGTLVYYFRTAKKKVVAANSTDNGDSFGSVYDLFDAPNSTTCIEKLTNYNVWVGIANSVVGNGEGLASRKNLYIYTSLDGVIFTKIPQTLYDFNNVDYAFEPVIYQDRFLNGILVFYTKTNNTYYDLVANFIPLKLLI